MTEYEVAFRQRWAEERRLRRTVPGEVRVVELDDPLAAGSLFVPGSLLVAWSADGARLTAAADEPGEAALELLIGEDLDDLDAAMVRGDLFDTMPFGAVRYRGRDLVDPAILPPSASAVGTAVLPWVGAPLDPAQFSAVTWVPDGAATALSVLVVCNPPQVDDDERRLIAALPSELAELGVEPSVTPAVAATFVTAVLAERYVNKLADQVERRAADQYRDWARNQQRRLDAAERRAALQAAANRNRHRNAAVLPAEPGVRSLDAGSPVGATIEELLLRRIRAQEQP